MEQRSAVLPTCREAVALPSFRLLLPLLRWRFGCIGMAWSGSCPPEKCTRAPERIILSAKPTTVVRGEFGIRATVRSYIAVAGIGPTLTSRMAGAWVLLTPPVRA